MSKAIPLPGYKTTKPAVPVLKAMFRDLGAQDACIQLQELCISYMENSAVATKAPVDAFLRLLYQGNGIPHGTYSFQELRELSSKSHLVLTYAIFEKTLEELIRYVKSAKPSLAASWTSKTPSGGGMPPLVELVSNLPLPVQNPLVSAPEYRLFEYYRAVRVASSHLKSSTATQANTAFGALSPSDMQHFAACYQLQAPNPPSALAFADFHLFTRAIKYYSRLLNEACG